MPMEAANLHDSYMNLVRQFPLEHIRDRAHLAQAQATIDRLLEQELDERGEAYLDALTDLVELYEQKHEVWPEASEADVLRLLLRANELSQAELARTVGMPQSTISAVLNGTRTLTKEQIVRIARFFNVAPAAFLPG